MMIRRSLARVIEDDEAQTPFELLRDKNLLGEVEGLIAVLDAAKENYLPAFRSRRWKPKTLEDVGRDFGVTRERIRQLQNIALTKLRRALAKKEEPAELLTAA